MPILDICPRCGTAWDKEQVNVRVLKLCPYCSLLGITYSWTTMVAGKGQIPYSGSECEGCGKEVKA